MWRRPRLPDRLPDEGGGIASLTAHEREILDMRCRREMSNNEIAEELNRSLQTVKNTMTRVLRKTGRSVTDGACYDLGQSAWLPVDAMRSESV